MGDVRRLFQQAGPEGTLHSGADVARTVRGGVLLLVGIVLGLGGWMTFAPLDGAIVALGFVKVDSNRKTIQHREGGIIKEILVKDGEYVQEGQVLVVLSDERVSSEAADFGIQIDAEQAKSARLEAARDLHDEVVFPSFLEARKDSPGVQSILAGERAFFHIRRQQIALQVALLEEQARGTEEEIAGITFQMTAEDRAAALLRAEVAANLQLDARRLVRHSEVLTMQRNLEEFSVRRGGHLTDIARAHERAADLRLRSAALHSDYVQRAADDLNASRARLFDLTERMRPARDATVRQQIKAPLSGTVVAMRINTLGGVVAPGDKLLDILPDKKALIVEARVEVIAVDNITVGQSADVRLTAYKQRVTPTVTGRVIYLAADRQEDEQTRQPYYTVRIALDPDSLKKVGLAVTAGMPTEVYINTGARTPLDYLLEPLTSFARRAGREP